MEMGLPKLNNKLIVTPKDQMTVAEFKRLGDVSELERIYELQTGRVLENGDVIDTKAGTYGSTADWQRG
jgi:hypothetical protein